MPQIYEAQHEGLGRPMERAGWHLENVSSLAHSIFQKLRSNSTLENAETGEQWHDWAHVFINGTGILNTWKWPDVEGLHDFKGPLMHSAKWNHDVDFDNKVVGVIGTGSTSVQIVPQLQKVCKQVQVFMRSATWISPPFGAGIVPCPSDRRYKADTIRRYSGS